MAALDLSIRGKIILTAALALVLMGGGVVGYHDTGFIAYERGDFNGAVAGLMRRVKAGDGYAAYLLGDIHERRDRSSGRVGSRRAADWFKKSARLGLSLGALRYAGVLDPEGRSPAICRLDLAVLTNGARAAIPEAQTVLGFRYYSGHCIKSDRVRATHHFGRAAALADYAGARFKKISGELGPADRTRLEALDRQPLVKISEAEFLKRFFSLADEMK